MALRWIDGAEGWANTTYGSRAYASVGTLSTTTARVTPGQRAWSLTSSHMQTPSLGVQNTWVLGIGLYLTNTSATQIRFFSGASEQCRFEVEDSGGLPRLKLMRGATQIGSSSATFQLNQWYYFEFKVTARTATNGAYEVRQNESTIMSGSSVNLADLGSDGVDSVGWGYAGAIRVDDVYILDSTGTANNDFLGDCVSVHILPTSDGHQNDMARSTGASNFGTVDDSPTAASSADYNASDTNGHEDYYGFENLPSTGLGTIFGIRISGSLAMAGAGSRVARYRYYDGAEFTLGSNVAAAGTSVVELPQIAEVNPNTAVGWLASEINAGEFGVEVVS